MQATIKKIFERNARALKLRPTLGRGTASTSVRLVDGLRCEISDGPWTLNVDLSPKSGGGGTAPDPGVYGRAALGACLAISYTQWAAMRELPIDDLRVDVEADYDARGMLGVGDVVADYTAIRFRVTVRSAAPDEQIESVLAEAEERCNYLNVFKRAREIQRDLCVLR